MTQKLIANREFISKLQDSDLELSVIFGIISTTGGFELLKDTLIVEIKANSKMTVMDVFFKDGAGYTFHRAIDI